MLRANAMQRSNGRKAKLEELERVLKDEAGISSIAVRHKRTPGLRRKSLLQLCEICFFPLWTFEVSYLPRQLRHSSPNSSSSPRRTRSRPPDASLERRFDSASQ